MLMGNSIEGRFPFLDYRVAELAAALPDRLRLRGLEEKHALRRAVGPLLPPEVSQRRKVPYRAPIAEVFAGPQAPEWVGELLSPANLAEAGLLAPDAVAGVAGKLGASGGAAGETDEMALVGAVSTMLLHERLVARPTLARALTPAKVVVADRVEPRLEVAVA
jgi:asparagine synthase (glutamine-hydrolysing)